MSADDVAVILVIAMFNLPLFLLIVGPWIAHEKHTCWPLRHDYDKTLGEVGVVDTYARRIRTMQKKRCRKCGWTVPGNREGWGTRT
jgi:hypothetical protein